MYDEVIKMSAESLFVKKDCDMNSPFVHAAISTVAARMASVECFMSPVAVYNEMMRVYRVGYFDKRLSNKEVCNLIGYDMDFKNASDAVLAYRKHKDSLEFLYIALGENIKCRKRESLIKKYKMYSD